MCNQQKSKHGTFGAYRVNITKPMPADKKIKMIAANMLTRFSKMQACCGYPGEPGC